MVKKLFSGIARRRGLASREQAYLDISSKKLQWKEKFLTMLQFPNSFYGEKGQLKLFFERGPIS